MEAGEVPVYVEILCEVREKMIDFLAAKGVQCRPFYPDLNHAKYFMNSSRYQNAEQFGLKGVYLPSGPEQSLANIQIVISAIREFDSRR